MLNSAIPRLDMGSVVFMRVQVKGLGQSVTHQARVLGVEPIGRSSPQHRWVFQASGLRHECFSIYGSRLLASKGTCNP